MGEGGNTHRNYPQTYPPPALSLLAFFEFSFCLGIYFLETAREIVSVFWFGIYCRYIPSMTDCQMTVFLGCVFYFQFKCPIDVLKLFPAAYFALTHHLVEQAFQFSDRNFGLCFKSHWLLPYFGFVRGCCSNSNLSILSLHNVFTASGYHKWGGLRHNPKNTEKCKRRLNSLKASRLASPWALQPKFTQKFTPKICTFSICI